MFGEDDNRWTWHSRDGLCCPSIRWLGPGHVHFRPEGKACSSARRISRTCRRQLWTGPRGVGVGALGGLARDSRWFDMARARRVVVFYGFCGDHCSSPKGLAEPQTSLGRGAGVAPWPCVTAKLLPGLQPGGLRSPLVLSLITPSHVVLAFPFFLNDHSILLPLKTLHSHDLIGISLSQRPSCDHIACI